MVNSWPTVLCTIFYIIKLGLCELTYIEVKVPLLGERSPPGSPWPLPRSWTRMTTQYTLSPDHFEMKTTEAIKCDVIDEALLRYRGYIFIDKKGRISPKHKELESLKITISDKTCGLPKLNDNENYDITIPDRGQSGLLKAQTIWGALRGLETFSQLVYQDSNTGYYLINATKIKDFPRFAHRGLMLDTARHFVPLNILLKNLDAMAFNKFNVFHWHIVDDQSYPLESKVFPNLTKLGAYTPNHVYKQSDVVKLIHQARLRGIRVIPEIDTPGHTQSIGKAFPSILTTCYDGDEPHQIIWGKHGAAEILNPARNQSFEVIKEILKEVRGLFKDEYIHLGMDEVYYDCWKSNPEIKQFMEKKGFKEYNQVEQYYVKRTLENAQALGFKYMIWQDPVDANVPVADSVVVQVWKGEKEKMPWQDTVEKLCREKKKVILSSCWYLNYIKYGEDWKDYYNCDPREINVTEQEKEFVIGGEACMWGEFVDQTNLLSRLWPRASAVAERLWSSGEDTKDVNSSSFRLDEHRCRMLRRGIPAQPILNGYCGPFEVTMDVTVSMDTSSSTIIGTNFILFLASILFIFIAIH